jgi:uncharacterized protein
MSLYEASVPQLTKMLQNLGKWLEKGAAYAKTKSFDPNVLLTARLAPDQYPLVRQVQSSCDAAKFAAARIAGKEAPKHPDTEQTFEEIQKRVQTAIAYLQTFKPEDFAGAEKRLIALPFLEGKVVTSSDYLYEMVLPNFYFHVTTAYAILRHNGVDLGKMDYLGALTLRDP